jgi:hypothetical protein
MEAIDEAMSEEQKHKVISTLGEQLKAQSKAGALRGPIEVTHAPKLPANALMAAIAGSLCAKQGHIIVQGLGKIMRPTKASAEGYVITEETIIFCSRCGASLQEIKGQ